MTTVYLIEEYEHHIPENIKKALLFCSKVADEANIPIFLIGGIVRDIIISRKNFDVDITVQGNAVEFAKLVQEKCPGICQVKEIHDAFKTAKIQFILNDNGDECVKIDLASTRKESYPCPACLPVIEKIGCELYEDVIRRDFTINSMALSLNQNSFCQLIDYLSGYSDIHQGLIRILHHNSFIDDPTRIIRALKFSVRFGYKLDDETQKLMHECLNSRRFDNLAGERVKLELKQALNINNAEVLTRFINENIYRLVDTELEIPPNIDDLSKKCEQTVKENMGFLYTDENIWLIYLGVLLLSRETLEKLYMSNQEQEIVINADMLAQKKHTLASAKTRFEVYEFFEKSRIESILAFLTKNYDLKDKVDLYLNELQDITLSINGDTLIKMGMQPGPNFGKLLREALRAKINGKIITHEEEIEFAKSF
ncbi:MAG: hypothetical protein A2Y25_11080 [Candidatus Melainabacteria bacterium GWF2_37_15]|nr:MAG: hypothetical protein A2Y25_11080 [Candidatus Melainabacteria bacterium GWF2_37_15]